MDITKQTEALLIGSESKSTAVFSPIVALMPIISLAVLAVVTDIIRDRDFPILMLCVITMAGWLAARAYSHFKGLRPGARIFSYHAACVAAFIIFVVIVLAIGPSDANQVEGSGEFTSGDSLIFMTAMFYGVPNFVLLIIDLCGSYLSGGN